MTTHEDLSLAVACARALVERNTASQGMGMRLLFSGPDSSQVGISVREDMFQGHGTGHDGYLFAVADSVFALVRNSDNDATVAIDYSIDYIAPARLDDTLTTECSGQSRSGRPSNYDVRIANKQEQLIALFHDKSYKVRGTVLAQETPE
ncbi:hotdog fold thioesterase [Pseudomonas sp. LB3P14]